MARKNTADAAKAKAQKQKKMVIGLSAVLVLAGGYAVKTMMSLTSGGGAQPVAAATTATTAAATPTPAPAATPTATPSAAPTLAGGLAPLASAPASGSIPGGTDLVAAARPTADVGQLQSFSLFESKDPFNAVTKVGAKGSGTGRAKPAKPAKPPVVPPAPPAPPPTAAVLEVNGAVESVASGGAFPASNPIFQLVSLTDTTAKVSIVGGSYATGSPTLTLTVNKPVTLVNTADGTRYTLTLLPQGTAIPAPGSTTGSSTTTAGTTTSTTPGTTTAPATGG